MTYLTPMSYNSLLDILTYRAQYQPDKQAYIFLRDGEIESDNVTYGKLDKQARVIASHLQSFKGERALLLYNSGIDFITAFFGCLYAGVIAVPVYPPKRNQKLSRLLSIVNDAQPKLALTTQSILADIEKRWVSYAELAQLKLIATDKLEKNIKYFSPHCITPDSLAFLQYTSGSTGNPKGVMVTHGNIIHNQQLIETAFGHNEKTISVGWLPLFHDMGLIWQMIHPIYLGTLCIMMPPVAFLQKPIRWLKAIAKYGATTSGGPNFAYDLCVSKVYQEDLVDLDLSSWDLAFNGAEPLRAKTLEQFASKFTACGFNHKTFYPCYGLAETTLFTTGINKNQSPVIQRVKATDLEKNLILEAEIHRSDSRVFVGCGHPYMDTKVVIVNPDSLTSCSPEQVGEIWVSSESVTAGYWNQPKVTQNTFQAYIKDTGEGPFLRTGDLGFLNNGELFVTGRLKDLIIIRGRNYYPQDIELTIENSHISLRSNCSAVFTIEIEENEQLIVACEVERTYIRKLNKEEVIKEIQIAVSTEHELEVYGVVLLKTGSIPKTSSGKIQRHACKKRFLENSLNIIEKWQKSIEINQVITNHKSELNHQDKSQNQQLKTVLEIETWLTHKLAQVLQIAVASIDLKQPFAVYGLDSVKAVSIAGELEQWLGVSVVPTIVYDYPTPKLLANYLGQKKSYLTEDLSQTKNETEAVAIIGKGCRFPGSNNPQAFWSKLRSGTDTITKVPIERWDSDNGWGGFLEQVDQFDAQFFNLSPRETINIDPQQRLLLEVSWEALENAGLAAEQLTGIRGGVFIGISSGDYAKLNGNLDNTQAYYAIGNALSIAANRLSYFLDWHGPSLAIDTACSSSLVAVHQACQSLLTGESEIALAGGVNLILTPQLNLTFSEAGMISADGRCKTFDAKADGYVRGEGCGVVVLKRLSDAIRDGDHIQAIIRGSAVNQDGLTNGITAPNGNSQQEVIHLALGKAGIKPSQISYVEAHGTGTSLGDPIEINSLQKLLSEGRESNQACWIGSVKTNIGHLEAAAGMAGLIKVILQLENQEITPHLHLKELNPYIKIENTNIKIPTSIQPWATLEEKRLAGISSFGFGGTNAHIILEEAALETKISPVNRNDKAKERPLHILTLSAKSENALLDKVRNYYNHLETHKSLAITDICFTASIGRSHFDHRLAIVASDKQELIDKLALISVQEEINGVCKGQICTNYKLPKIAFLFTGQGSQYIDMGRQLYETQPVFRQILEQCDKILKPYLKKSILDIVYPENNQQLDNSIINQTAYSQPALFALEYALYKLWESWGIKPSVVMGHSLGEYVAATVAGVFSLEDGLKLIAHRGRLMQQLPTGGEMLSIMASYEQVNQLIAPYSKQVAIAAINGPQSVVISGESLAITKVKEILDSLEIKTKQLQVSHAFHSHLMEPMLAEFAQLASEITYNQPNIPLISNVTGNRADESIATTSYWVNHIRQPVKFAQSMQTLHQEGCQIFLEIGAKPILLGMGRECLIDIKKLWLPSLRTSKPDWQQILQSLGELYVQGIQVDWLGFDKNYSYKKVVLPTYPWQRKRYWITDIQQKSNDDKNMSKNQVNKEKTIFHQARLRLSNPASLSFPKNPSFIDKTTKRELANLTVQSIQVEESFQVTQQHKTKELKDMSREQIEQLKEEYENKGYCQIKNFFNYSEIKTIQQTLDNAKNESHIPKEKVTLKLAKNDYIDTTDHAYDLVKYDFVYSLIKNKLSILNYITGKKIVIMHNALFSVEPNQTGLPWHVGVGSFSFTETKDFGASIWIPLDEITKEYRGGMQYVSTKIFPGQFYYTIHDLHLKNNLKWDESKGDLNQYVANANTILNNITEDVLDYTIQDGYEEHEYNVGDVLFFNKYVLHRSVPLKPGLHKLRRAFVIRLVDYDTRVDEERLGLFAQYSQLHSRVYKTLPRYNKDSVLVMVSRAIKQGLKSPYLRDIPYVKKTLLKRIAVESEKITETSSLSKLDNLDINSENITLENISRQNNLDIDFNQIKETLKQSLAEALYTDISEIKEEQKFIDLGLDSIVGVEWINVINKIYNLNIKATKLYDYPNLVQLTEYIFQKILNKEENIQVDCQQSSQTENNINNKNHQSLTKLENLELSNNFQISLLEVKKVLKQKLAEVLYTDISEIKEEKKFTDLGLDSIVGVEWINVINKTYNLNVKATKLYDYPTLLDLSEYITEEIYSKNRNELSQENQHSPEKSLVNQNLSQKSQEDIRQKIRPILNKVVNHELTIQEATKIIQEIKQQSKTKNDLQEFDIKNNSIFELIKKYIYEIVPELAKISINPNDSLKNLGIDSVNRAEIIVMVMEELDLHIPLIELAKAKNIGEVANLFAVKLEANYGI